MSSAAGYRRATQHPWPCLLFVLPLLAAYEMGVLGMGGEQPEALRTGADHWMRSRLTTVHPHCLWVPPAVLLVIFVVWTCSRWSDRPREMTATLSGMLLESVGFALGLWGLSQALVPLLLRFGIELTAGGGDAIAGFRQTVRYLGSGIYEEAIFRLFLFSAMLWLLTRFELKESIAALLAAVGSALLFSAAHHFGPHGEEYDNYRFLFRLLAGLYFAFLFRYRGFGVAVGSHACYNVVVSFGAT